MCRLQNQGHQSARRSVVRLRESESFARDKKEIEMKEAGMLIYLGQIRDLLITGEATDAYNARIKVQLLIDRLNAEMMERATRASDNRTGCG
jgi:hypothetical protein